MAFLVSCQMIMLIRTESLAHYDGIKIAEDYHIPQPYIDPDAHKTFKRPNVSENLPKVMHS